MGNRPLKILLVLILVADAAVAAYIALSDPYDRDMRPVYAVIAAGEQGWGDAGTQLLDGIIARSANRNALAERLMQESDGSLVAEGMVLAVRSHHPAARSLVSRHLGDHRWNWYLADNDQLAKQLLLHLDGKPVEAWITSWLARTAAS